ncbi:REP-associated tyrosine transposase [Adhaeribacter radiodurans]|uniref:Transposase n=1 Tax=Adhaeribacter radiodurans TaxID=2745197 RepID=A0A7L7LEU2_9BACT|nr:transposase [Adhaeribacter radiodurans]QMU31382.1 transposase [Adhaeribacter radiodurans]
MQLTPRPYSLRNPEGIYFVTFSVVFWLDVFVRQSFKNLFVESLNFCIKNKGLRVHAWCLMTSHVHLIISAAEPEKVNLSDILRDLKKFTASQIIREIETGSESRREWLLDKFRFAASQNSRNTTYQFWQQDNHAEELLSNKFIDQKLNYIHENPVKEGWVEEPQFYVYSSARDYSGNKGLVPINFLD